MIDSIKAIILEGRRQLLYIIGKKFIISFPKSGRTWVRYFLAKYFESLYGVPIILDFFTLVKRNKNIPRFHFTHGNFFDERIDDLQKTIKLLKGKDVLMIVRDPRDVVISFYYHNKKRSSFLGADSMSLPEFIRHRQLGIERIIQYMNKLYSSRDSFHSFEFIKYENLIQTKDTFKIIIHFLEQKYDEDSFNYAYNQSSFKNMHEVEISNKIDNPILQVADVNDPDSHKVRKGIVGGYKEECSVTDIEYMDNCMKKLDPVFQY